MHAPLIVPPIDLPVEETAHEIIDALQKQFAAKGLRGLVEATIDQCVEQELKLNEAKLWTYLTDNWDLYFPGVEMSDQNLLEAQRSVAVCLTGKKSLIRQELCNYICKAESGQANKSSSLFISDAEISTILRPPCNGGLHDFGRGYYHDSNVVTYTVNVRSTLRKRPRFWIYRHCGVSCLRRVWVTVRQCINCTTVRVENYSLGMYCDQCGFVKDKTGSFSGDPLVEIFTLIPTLGLTKIVVYRNYVRPFLESKGLQIIP